MLNRRHIDVQYQNLATMCKMTVKSLIDYACVNTHVDEDCEEFVNFCAVFEQMVAHRIRPYQKRVWHRGQGLPRHFWEVMLESHRQSPLFRSCIPNIEAIESIKSPKAKLRAFVRVALMEKRLSDYLQWLQNNHTLMEECYLDGALFISEEGLELCGDIIGLSAIDFNFCLRGNENELLGPLEINYVPFLNYIQSRASRLIDEEEMLQLSGKTTQENRNLSQSPNDDKIKLQTLERDFRGVKEQKDYLEELVRLRERQMGETNMRVDAMRSSIQVKEKEWEGERRMLDTCVLELQQEISALREQNNLLKSQVSDLQLFKSRLDYRDVQMVDLASVPISSPADNEGQNEEEDDQIGDRSRASPTEVLKDPTSTKQPSSDQRSILSGISDHIRLKEDSQSLVPLTGSLADVNIAMIRDNQQHSGDTVSSDWKKAEQGGVNTNQDSEGRSQGGAMNVELTVFEPQDQKNKTDTSLAPAATTDNSHHPLSSPLPSTTSPSHQDTLKSVTNPDPDMKSKIDGGSQLELDESYVVTGVVEMVKITKSGELHASSSSAKEKSCQGNEGLEGKTSSDKDEHQNIPSASSSATSSSACAVIDNNSNNSGTTAITEALQDLEKAFDSESDNVVNPDEDNQDRTQAEDSRSSWSAESNVSSGNSKENTSLSEPEILDRVNTSSEGSDAAWEMLSDADENDKQM